MLVHNLVYKYVMKTKEITRKISICSLFIVSAVFFRYFINKRVGESQIVMLQTNKAYNYNPKHLEK